MTIKEALYFIKNNGTPNNQEYLNHQARYILSKSLKMSPSDISMHIDRNITEEDEDRLKSIVDRLNCNEPLQYILNESEFYGIKIKCQKPILIPRPDTEILVDTIIGILDKFDLPDNESLLLFEVGTGSGAIPLSILLNCDKTLTITSIDINKEACRLAEDNFKIHMQNPRLKKHTWKIKEENFFDIKKNREKYHLIFSNPPYISYTEYKKLDQSVLNYEDKQALTDFSDGLKFYRKLKEFCISNLYVGGYLVVEHSYNQAIKIRELFNNENFYVINQVKDYGGNDRVSVIKKIK